MKVQIKTRVMQGGHRIADLSVEGDTLIEAITAFSTVVAPHLENERQIQIVEVMGWCDSCRRFHYDLTAIGDSFGAMNTAALDQIKAALKGAISGDALQAMQAAMQHTRGKDGPN